jgi:hypothetical protein
MTLQNTVQADCTKEFGLIALALFEPGTQKTVSNTTG